MPHWEQASTDDLRRSLDSRYNRFQRLMEMKTHEDIDVPQLIIAGEIDLVRQALDRLEDRFITDKDAVRKEREKVTAEIDAEIAACGGQANWEHLMFDEEGNC